MGIILSYCIIKAVKKVRTMFDTKQYDDRFAAAVAHFEDELKKVRTGRAHPSMLDGLTVEAYGQAMPLNQVANVVADVDRRNHDRCDAVDLARDW